MQLLNSFQIARTEKKARLLCAPGAVHIRILLCQGRVSMCLLWLVAIHATTLGACCACIFWKAANMTQRNAFHAILFLHMGSRLPWQFGCLPPGYHGTRNTTAPRIDNDWLWSYFKISVTRATHCDDTKDCLNMLEQCPRTFQIIGHGIRGSVAAKGQSSAGCHKQPTARGNNIVGKAR